MNQYLIFKLKDEFLPDIIKEYIKKEIINWDRKSWRAHYIDQKFFRKIKIQNIDETISIEEKKIFDFLMNSDFTKLLTNEEYESLKINSGTSGTSGFSGTSGTSSYSGASFASSWVLNNVFTTVMTP